MKQVLAQGGAVFVRDVPTPAVGPRNVLVRVAWSCISVGTELAGVRISGMPLYRRALRQPENVKKVLQAMREQGIKRTWDRVAGQLAAGSPLGYSAAGTIIEVGAEVEGFRVGARVACAGAGIANHAEIIDVPVNLTTLVPDALDLDSASTVTLGAIALQGVRRAQPSLGETFVVVGLGVLGQLTAQLLGANGCRVIGTDIDAARVAAAKSNGAFAASVLADDEYIDLASRLTDGHGADGVIVTASAQDSELIGRAFQACRKKARVVLVGDVGLNLRRSDMYGKELDLLVSTSYGPGRYDPLYEEGGRDYPLPYVRWTENRNMEAYLRLLAEGSVTLAGLAQQRFDIDQAPLAYAALQSESEKPLLALLRYPESSSVLARKLVLREVSPNAGRIRVALVGAGAYAQAMHLPNLRRLRDDYEIHCIVSRTGTHARSAAQKWQAAYATTDLNEALSDADVNLAIVATRHDLHASIALQALRSGKHVLVEKPLATSYEQLDNIEKFFIDGNVPVLMAGFNRRFAPAIQRAKEVLAGRTTPMVVNYRMNAGYVSSDHWVHGPEGAGRNIGEACHIYDLFAYLTGARPTSVSAHCISPKGKQWRRNDNFVATIEYSDGSVCTLTYTAMGHKAYPKERMEVFCDGKVLSLDDYKSLEVSGARGAGWQSAIQDKGQVQELRALAACLRRGLPWPISLEEQLDTTRTSLEIERRLCAA
jgi:predicted dehydrogenase/threonine dehydrogenase-like Zn-dependent dehydrogenase